MRFRFKVLCALILALMAHLFALNGWPGVLVGVALPCMASAFFIDDNKRLYIVGLIGGLPPGAFWFSAGLDYLLGNVNYVPDECTGSRRWFCQAVNEVLQLGGPSFVGLLWFCAAACLFLFTLRASSYVWKRRSALK